MGVPGGERSPGYVPTHLGESRGPGRGAPSWSPGLLCPCYRASLGRALLRVQALLASPSSRPSPPPRPRGPHRPPSLQDPWTRPALHHTQGSTWDPQPGGSGWKPGQLLAMPWPPGLWLDVLGASLRCPVVNSASLTGSCRRPLPCSKATPAPLSSAFRPQLAARRYKAS